MGAARRVQHGDDSRRRRRELADGGLRDRGGDRASAVRQLQRLLRYRALPAKGGSGAQRVRETGLSSDAALLQQDLRFGHRLGQDRHNR